ncbi:hypothetical protein PFISCL1PPCAC_10001, partial [Pristionchus fissidentatus]
MAPSTSLRDKVSFQDIVERVKKNQTNPFTIAFPFRRQPQRTIDFSHSPLQVLLYALRSFGIFWSVRSHALDNVFGSYNLLLIFIHFAYIIALSQSIFSTKLFISPTHVPPFSAKIQLANALLSLWLLVRIRFLTPRFLAESTDCLAGNPPFSKRKARMLRYCSIIFTIISVSIPLLFTLIHFISTLSSSRFDSAALRCGSFCVIFESLLTFLVSTISLLSLSLIAIILLSDRLEASELVHDIKRCTGGTQVDPLIFRYQSLESCVVGAESLLSSSLLVVPSIAAVAVFVTYRFIFNDYHDVDFPFLAHSSLALLTIVVVTMSMIALTSSLNGQLCLFREAARRMADLQQFAFTPTQMIRLLLFTLRLTDHRLVLTAGSICAVNRQNLIIVNTP